MATVTITITDTDSHGNIAVFTDFGRDGVDETSEAHRLAEEIMMELAQEEQQNG